jgi:hypothetical protein
MPTALIQFLILAVVLVPLSPPPYRNLLHSERDNGTKERLALPLSSVVNPVSSRMLWQGLPHSLSA